MSKRYELKSDEADVLVKSFRLPLTSTPYKIGTRDYQTVVVTEGTLKLLERAAKRIARQMKH